MISGGLAPKFGKEGLGPDSSLRWSAIMNRLIGSGSSPQQAANVANPMTRETIARRLGMPQYIQPPQGS